MRSRTTLLARVSRVGVLVSVLGGCAGGGGTPFLAAFPEQRVDVPLPATEISPGDRMRYENNRATTRRIERRCVYKPIAGARCDTSVALKITVIEGAKFVRASGHTGGPQLVGIIENLGSRSTFDGFWPGKQALVAVARGSGTVLVRVRFNQMAGSPNFAVDSAYYGTLADCHPDYVGLSSDMSFRGCDPNERGTVRERRTPGEVLASSQVTFRMPLSEKSGHGEPRRPRADFVSLDDPLWLRCSPGCCTS